jgi:glycosyltransferase involved in cell wall biosynthesis
MDTAVKSSPVPALYAVHSGLLYGTERMAIATLEALGPGFRPVLIAPPGPAIEEARRRGLEAAAVPDARALARCLAHWLRAHRSVAFLATTVVQSVVFSALNAAFRRARGHLHVVHGGTDERLSYARKRFLLPLDVRFVTVSEFVRERLVAHGVRAARTTVIENFLTPERIATAPRRRGLREAGERRAIVVSRMDEMKRVDLLLDAIARSPELHKLHVRVLGGGGELETLRARARDAGLPVVFAGFQPDVEVQLAEADFYVHTCPCEPFGLSVLEAFAAGVPVLVPDRGGAGALVDDGVSGFRYRAGDADDLARGLVELATLPGSILENVATSGRALLASRFDASARGADYARLLRELVS